MTLEGELGLVHIEEKQIARRPTIWSTWIELVINFTDYTQTCK